jgi:hypothetical protein
MVNNVRNDDMFYILREIPPYRILSSNLDGIFEGLG